MRRKTQRRWGCTHVDARRDAADVDYISCVFCLPDRNSSLIFFFFFFSFSPRCKARLELMYPRRPGIPMEKKHTHICFFFSVKSSVKVRFCVFWVGFFFSHTCGSKGHLNSSFFFFFKNERATLNTAAPKGTTATQWCEWTLSAVLHHCYYYFIFFKKNGAPFVVIVMQHTIKLKSTQHQQREVQ